MEKLSYALGMVIGHNLKGMNVTNLNSADFAQAVADVLAGEKTALTDDEAQTTVSTFLDPQPEEQSKAARAEGEAFLAENAKKEGVTVLPSGLQYTVLREGEGRKPAATDSVKCHYEGTLTNGTVFDSSYRRGEPATFPLNGGRKAYSSWPKAPNTASSSPITWPTANAGQDRAFRPTPPSYSM